MSSKTISILGCGWLGLPLAKTLISNSFSVKGSTAHKEGLPALTKEGISAYLLKCVPRITGENIDEFFHASVLIISLPFKRDFKDPKIYQQQIDSVITHGVEPSTIDFVVFLSSTSVYPGSIPIAVEDAPVVPDNPRAGVLWDIEKSLLSNTHFDTTVVRLAGLYGETRPIGHFFSRQKECRGGDQPVNVIHQEDGVHIIREIIKQDIRGEIFNACADDHPSRRELYTKIALEKGLLPPDFVEGDPLPQKIVSNKKVKERLHYQCKHSLH